MRQHIIFSDRNIADYLLIEKSRIKSLNICFNTCKVRLTDGGVYKVTTKDIKPIMEANRQNRIDGIQIREMGTYYKAYNPKTRNWYWLQPEADHIKCSCPDYENQLKFFPKEQVICKHGYALLNYLGCNSLTTKEYKEMVQDLYLISEYEAICDRNEMMSYAWVDDSRFIN